MGDHRLNVEISLVGWDGKSRKISRWLNWQPDRPAEIYKAMVELAEESQLQVDDQRWALECNEPIR